jgi:transcriptional regulator with XRE-family HTH domain
MITYNEYDCVFDDVQFGIDVRRRRSGLDLTQSQLAHLIGYKDGVSISRIECARSTDEMSIRRYYRLCSVLGLNPRHYTDIQVKET